MDQLVENKRHARKRILWGLMLVGLGVLFLCERLDDIGLAMLWRFWPLILLVSGLIDVLAASCWKHIAEGMNQIVIGAWLFVCFEHLWGLTFSNSWPMLLIGVGLTIVLRGLPDGTQNKN